MVGLVCDVCFVDLCWLDCWFACVWFCDLSAWVLVWRWYGGFVGGLFGWVGL